MVHDGAHFKPHPLDRGYKAKAKFNYGQSSKIASTAEGSLATAEARKVFFPFGVGLTAITAAACVTLRIFNEKVGSFFPEPAGGSFSTVLAGDNVILMLWPKSRTCSFERRLIVLKVADPLNRDIGWIIYYVFPGVSHSVKILPFCNSSMLLVRGLKATVLLSFYWLCGLYSRQCQCFSGFQGFD